MPGVPRGRGCNACREQKKKCDFSVYPCPRCKRLNITCIGHGQQRYKFITDQNSQAPVAACRQPAANDSTFRSVAQRRTHLITPVVFHDLTNAHTRLVGSFMDKIKPSMGVRYNLAWTYGDYLNDIPARLGVNEALDSACEALLAAFDRFPANQNGLNTLFLEKYTSALAALRKCLDDPIQAKSSETLGAILLMMNCQQFICPPISLANSHSQGAAQIIRLRGQAQGCDPFERNLLLSLRGVVLFTSVVTDNDQVVFSDREWIDLFDNQTQPATLESQAVQCLTRLPNLKRRAKKVLQDGDQHQAELVTLRCEARDVRADLDPVLTALRARLTDLNEKTDAETIHKNTLLALCHCHYLRVYALGIAIVIFIDKLIITLAPDAAEVQLELHNFAVEIVHLAKIASQYRPLGASALGICLVAAELGAGESHTRLAARQLRVQYASDFGRSDDLSMPC